MDVKETVGGCVGTALSATGTWLQTNDILQTISLIITIIGGIITFIVIPVLNAIKKAKEDGKITIDETIDIVNKAKDGIDVVKNIKKDSEEK